MSKRPLAPPVEMKDMKRRLKVLKKRLRLILWLSVESEKIIRGPDPMLHQKKLNDVYKAGLKKLEVK